MTAPQSRFDVSPQLVYRLELMYRYAKQLDKLVLQIESVANDLGIELPQVDSER